MFSNTFSNRYALAENTLTVHHTLHSLYRYALAENTLTVCITRVDVQPRVIIVDKLLLEREQRAVKLSESTTDGPFDAGPIECAHYR
jgi:hypothetical protein